MAKLSRYLLSPKQLRSPVSEPANENESDESKELQKQEKEAGLDKKKAKKPSGPSLAQMIKIAGRKK